MLKVYIYTSVPVPYVTLAIPFYSPIVHPLYHWYSHPPFSRKQDPLATIKGVIATKKTLKQKKANRTKKQP